MKKIFCDKCEKEIKDMESRFVISMVEDNGYNQGKFKDVELCRECKDLFQEWLKDNPKVFNVKNNNMKIDAELVFETNCENLIQRCNLLLDNAKEEEKPGIIKCIDTLYELRGKLH